MNKKVLVSMLTIGVVAAAAIGGTIAYFSDREVSTGNVMVAGTIDLKVDHRLQSYNGKDCKTCGLVVASRPGIEVKETGNDAVAAWVHPNWTSISGAQWIWATNEVEHPDQNEAYTFLDEFMWEGPVTAASLTLNLAADNKIIVKLNGNEIYSMLVEHNYESAVVVPVAADKFVAGKNTLEVWVQNIAIQGSTPESNPAAAIYKLDIGGQCDPELVKVCHLWYDAKDLGENSKFWTFDDIKPGDYGTNLISLHPKTNDSKVCSYVMNTQGALGDGINLFVWKDDGDGVYQTTESPIYSGPATGFVGKLFSGTIAGNSTAYMGIAWCAGSVEGAEGVAKGTAGACSPSTMGNEYQGTNFNADFGFYAIQARHNDQFECPSTMPVEE